VATAGADDATVTRYRTSGAGDVQRRTGRRCAGPASPRDHPAGSITTYVVDLSG
jgi:hypothetical protein